jgi:hypothetical protein
MGYEYVDIEGCYINHIYYTRGTKENGDIEIKQSMEYDLIDKNNIAYTTESRNNIALSIDVGEYAVKYDGVESAKFAEIKDSTNAEFSSPLKPYESCNLEEGSTDEYADAIKIKATRTVSAQDDADQLEFDNMAEIVKIENSVGRRDMFVVTGNANPVGGFMSTLEDGTENFTADIFAEAHKERDSSATEVVTFAPPTGIKAQVPLTMQVLLISVIALAIVAVGVVIIKKTVLK